MKYLICFLLCSFLGQAQVMTKDYGSPKIPSKAVVASLYTNLIPDDYYGAGLGSGISMSFQTKRQIIPIILGRNSFGNNYNSQPTFLGAGYGMRHPFRKLYLSGQILPKIWFGNLSASSIEFNFGVSREFNNNLVLRVDVGPGFWYGERVDYDHPPDPVTFTYPTKYGLEYFTNYRLSIGYRI